jgi:dUTP pyrophosphatase
MDLAAHIESDITIQPGCWEKIPTGFCMALPQGYEAQIRSRSGLSAKHAVVVLNSPGTIDADYRGEIIVLLANFGKDTFVVNHGMRIAQMVIQTYTVASWHEVSSLDETERNLGGFGSTGT